MEMIDVSPRLRNRLERIIKALCAIVSSPNVEEYAVGITSDPTGRRSAYGTVDSEMSALVLLEWNLGRDDALELEEALQGYICFAHKNSPVFRKAVDRMHTSHRRSAHKDKPNYLYVVW